MGFTTKDLYRAARKRATDTWKLAGLAPEAAQALFRSAKRRASLNTRKAARQLMRTAVLPSPLASSRYVASALAPVFKKLLSDLVKDVVAAKKAKFEPLVTRLGATNDDLAQMMEKAVIWKPLEEEGLAGQVATLAGALLERLRKGNERFIKRADRATSIVDDFNRRLLALEGDVSAADANRRVQREIAGGNKELFDKAQFFEEVTDGDNKLLTDGMDLAFNQNEELLLPAFDECKLWTVGRDVLPQIDEVFERIAARGIRLRDGRHFPPNKIKFPPKVTLTAYVEDATKGTVKTPQGREVTRIPVTGTEHLREFAEELLVARYKALGMTKVP
jgi:hypothetical protein